MIIKNSPKDKLSKQNEEDIEAIASDAVEDVTRGQTKAQITNKGKSIIARAIAEALKESIGEA